MDSKHEIIDIEIGTYDNLQSSETMNAPASIPNNESSPYRKGGGHVEPNDMIAPEDNALVDQSDFNPSEDIVQGQVDEQPQWNEEWNKGSHQVKTYEEGQNNNGFATREELYQMNKRDHLLFMIPQDDYPPDIINIGGLYPLPDMLLRNNKRNCNTCFKWARTLGIPIPFCISLVPTVAMGILLNYSLNRVKISTAAVIIIQVVYWYFAGMFFWHTVCALFRNAGAVTKERVEKCSIPGYPGAFPIHVPERMQHHVPQYILDNLRTAPKFCRVCNNWKPPRTHHCSTCEQCTMRMDHHCPYLFNCVGVGNHGHFLLFWLFASLGSGFCFIMSLVCWGYKGWIGFMTLLDTNTVIAAELGLSFFICMLTLCSGIMWGCSGFKNKTQFDISHNEDPTARHVAYASLGQHNVFILLPWNFYSTKIPQITLHGLLGKYAYASMFLPIPIILDWEEHYCLSASVNGMKGLLARINKYERLTGKSVEEMVRNSDKEKPGKRIENYRGPNDPIYYYEDMMEAYKKDKNCVVAGVCIPESSEDPETDMNYVLPLESSEEPETEINQRGSPKINQRRAKKSTSKKDH